MTSPVKLDDDLVDHRSETAKEKHRQLSATRGVHVSTLTVSTQFDNLVVVSQDDNQVVEYHVT
jgi:hypothetical protein